MSVLYDMETFAFARVAEKFGTRFLSIRVVTDKPLTQNSYSVFEENIESGMKLINGIINTDKFVEGLYALLEG